MNLPEFSVRHSILGNMLTIIVLFVGLLTTVTLQREVFPVVDLDIVVISTAYPNASPEEVENLITMPIEEEIRDVDGIDEYTSTSLEGLSVVVAEIDTDARNVDRIINDTQRRVDRVDDLPEEAKDPLVEAIELQHPVIRVCLTGPVSEQVMRDYGDYLKVRLEGIQDVGKVTKLGWRDEEFWVEVDPETLEAQELALVDVMQSLARRNVNRPGGKIPKGQQEVILRTIGEFHTPEEIREVIVRSNTDGNHIRVGDVATVRRTFEKDATLTRVNGHRALVLLVEQKDSGDTIKIADATKSIVEEERANLPEGLEIALVDDVSYYVKRRLKVLTSNGLIGMVLVVGCLFLFLNFRMALITAIGIPFSFLATFLLMSFFGVTINLMTMFGLIIVIGMLVDDAIIVGENIFRHMEGGSDPRTAAVEGATEVMYPVISTVLTTIAAFFPLMFLPDVMGKFLRWMPVIVMIALSASLVESILVLPCHVADFVRPLKAKVGKNGTVASGHRWMARTNRVYTPILKAVLRHRYVFLLVILLIFAGSILFAVKKQKIDVFPADLIDVFTLQIEAPQGTVIETTEGLVARAEERVAELPDDELDDYMSYVGQFMDPHGRMELGTHYGQIIIYLKSQHLRERKTQLIINELREECADIEGVERIQVDMIKPGPPVGKDLEFKVRGRDFEVLEEIAEEIKAFLAGQEGVADIRDDFEEGKDEMHVLIDQSEAARLGVDVTAIAQTVYAAFEGAESTTVREGKEDLEVRVKLQEPYRSQFDQLERLQVPNKGGRLISLGRVARFEQTSGLPTIAHHDGDRVIAVTASLDKEVASAVGVNVKLEREFANIAAEYPGYHLIRGGEWEESRKLLVNMTIAFLTAVLLIYTILSMQFNSFLQPFVVMAAIPLGLIGVIVALYLHQKPVSMMAMLGMVGLTGVVVNDAIVLVSFVNNLRRRGVPIFEALVEAGRKRLRPILLTSVTTVSGLVPVIYGWGGYEPFIAPAAIALAYGLVFATILTLLVVPAIYYVATDVKRGVSRAVSFLTRRGAPPGDA